MTYAGARGQTEQQMAQTLRFTLGQEGLAAAFDADRAAEIIAAIGTMQVDLTMPTFTFESQFGLSATLKAMGMPVAFTPVADFSGMNGTGGLLIQDVIHKAFVLVNEVGTEAAAATGVTVGATSIPLTISVKVDRPFVFLVRDIETGTILFVGRVVDPR